MPYTPKEPSRTVESDTTTYTTIGQPTNVELPDGSEVEFGYDGDGRRITKKTSSGEIKYIYAGDLVVQEEDESGNIIASYLYDDIGRLISKPYISRQ